MSWSGEFKECEIVDNRPAFPGDLASKWTTARLGLDAPGRASPMWPPSPQQQQTLHHTGLHLATVPAA